jgi:hypothetical protein
MSAKNWGNRDPATQCCWPDCANSVADMRILWNRATAARCQVLHWKSGHKIGCKRKGRVDFALFNIPGIAKSLMPDNEPKHGGVAEPIRRFMKVDSLAKRN